MELLILHPKLDPLQLPSVGFRRNGLWDEDLLAGVLLRSVGKITTCERNQRRRNGQREKLNCVGVATMARDDSLGTLELGGACRDVPAWDKGARSLHLSVTGWELCLRRGVTLYKGKSQRARQLWAPSSHFPRLREQGSKSHRRIWEAPVFPVLVSTRIPQTFCKASILGIILYFLLPR